MSNFGNVIIKDVYGFKTECTPMDELRVATVVRLVGSTFTGTTLDPNFWITSGSAATCTQANGEVVLASTTNPGASIALQSVRYARYVGGSSNRYRAQIQFSDTGVVNNTKKWGMTDGTDGAYFKISGSFVVVVSACTLRAGVETAVASASWNGSTVLPTLTNCNTYEIYITNRKVYFVIAGTLVHTVDSISQTWSATTTLPVRAENTNSGNTTNTTMSIRVHTIYRLGQLETLPTYKHISGGATTWVCKYGAGNLHRITLNNPTNNSITVYDGISVAGAVIAVINPGSSATPVTLDYNLPFATGLTIVTAGAPDLTIIFE
jgi:hypothetical protein